MVTITGETRKKKINSNHLKLIVIVAMIIDHVADLLYPGMSNNAISIVLHIIGRLTAPIMFFFICEGFYYTKNLKKQILSMSFLVLIYAIVSFFCKQDLWTSYFSGFLSVSFIKTL